MILAKEESQTEVCATRFNMSTTAETIQSKPDSWMGSQWSLWLRQISAIMRLDVRRNFFGKRAVLIYLLALMPIGLLSLMAVIPPGFAWNDFTQYPQRFSLIYNALILRTVVFFGCAWIFMNLFRGEIVDRSLHYYFLSALRREVLLTGKYLSGLVTSIILFTTVTVVSMFLLFFPHFFSPSVRFFLDGPGIGQLFTYAVITILACVGYGAFFMVVGLFFRNPIIPALVLYGWEWINFLLPPLLKKISVIHYLNSLVPVPLSEGPFAVVAEPTPAWISIPGLLIVTILVLFVASRRIRRMEIRYGSD
ncbi:MAG: type transport system permease protein [Blastocatellia bacterium]|nr:type transport system permease protein [Blastocatellia bacterium]